MLPITRPAVAPVDKAGPAITELVEAVGDAVEATADDTELDVFAPERD
jgi:hypothetical protein